MPKQIIQVMPNKPSEAAGAKPGESGFWLLTQDGVKFVKVDK